MARAVKYCARFGLFLFLFLFSLPAPAARYDIWYIPEVSSSFAGGYTAAASTETGPPYTYTDDLFGFTTFNYLSIYDTGASGILLSTANQQAFGIPLSGETYSDIGIGGYEDFDVSLPTYIRLCPTSMVTMDDDSYAQIESHYANYGQFKMQVSRNESLPVNLIGTPILAHKIMHANLDDWRAWDLSSGVIIGFTEFLPSLPATFNGPRALTVPLRMDDFRQPGAPVSLDLNPQIPNVRVRDRRRTPDNQSQPKDWLLDTGAQFTMIGRDYAAEIGIDLDNEVPFDSVDISGVGGNTTIYGYLVDEVVLPTSDGDEVAFHNVVVFVPDEGALPVDLAGIFGMNMLYGNEYMDDSFNLWVIPNLVDWYFDGPGQTLTLVPDLVTVQGTVTLQNYTGDVTAVPVTIELRAQDNTTGVETHTLYLDSTGHYSFLTNMKEMCDIAAKAPHWLRQKKIDNISGPITVDFTLTNGDVDDNNRIDSADLSILQAVEGTVLGDADFIPAADLNGDHKVDAADLNILTAALGRTGDFIPLNLWGTLTLRDFAGDATAEPIQIDLQCDGSASRTDTVHVDTDGNFIVGNISAGTYRVAFKGTHWLRKSLTGITVTDDTSLGAIELANGDCNNNNAIDSTDLSIVLAAMNAARGQTGYDPAADLDGSGVVDQNDLSIVTTAMDRIGDN